MADAKSGKDTISPPGWHTLEIDQVLKEVEGRLDGLTEAEAEQRLSTYGPNRLKAPKRRGPLARLLSQFHNVLIGGGGENPPA